MSESLSLYHVDAFTSRVFGGNPAAVVPLEAWPDDALLQAVAAENNLSETAFFTGAGGRYHIRWFTPVREVELCGHATLASSYVITRFLEPEAELLRFDSQSGELIVRRDGELLELDFPVRPAEPADEDLAARISAALGAKPVFCGRTRNPDPDSDKLLAELGSAEEVATLAPDVAALRRLPGQGVIATARGEDCDFVSRYFVPKLGILEDPATGSAHCTLTPYWAGKLGRSQLDARQVSARGGRLACRLAEERVLIAGRCALYLRGNVTL